MPTSDQKTKPTAIDPHDFVAAVEHPQRRADGFRLIEMMRDITGHEPVMWGPSIIGFGAYHYRYESGREGDAPAAAFSPRKANLVVHLIGGYEDLYQPQLAKLGPYKVGKSCLYLSRLDKIDEDILRWMIADSYQRIKDEYPG